MDRATAARFGITPATIDNALYDAFGQRIISTIFTQSNQCRVILEADPTVQESLASLNSHLPARPPAPGRCRCRRSCGVGSAQSPLLVGHLSQFPSATFSFNLAPGDSLGQAIKAITAAEAALGPPPGLVTGFQGAALALQSALRNELLLVLAASSPSTSCLACCMRASSIP